MQWSKTHFSSDVDFDDSNPAKTSPRVCLTAGSRYPTSNALVKPRSTSTEQADGAEQARLRVVHLQRTPEPGVVHLRPVQRQSVRERHGVLIRSVARADPQNLRRETTGYEDGTGYECYAVLLVCIVSVVVVACVCVCVSHQDVEAGRFEQRDLIGDGQRGEAGQLLGELHGFDDALGGKFAEFVPQVHVQRDSVIGAVVLQDKTRKHVTSRHGRVVTGLAPSDGASHSPWCICPAGTATERCPGELFSRARSSAPCRDSSRSSRNTPASSPPSSSCSGRSGPLRRTSRDESNQPAMIYLFMLPDSRKRAPGA